MLGRPVPNQCIILSYPALLWSYPVNPVLGLPYKAVLHESWFSMQALVQYLSNPNLICQPHPASALIVQPTVSLSLPRLPCHTIVALGCPRLDKSPYSSSKHEYIRETLRLVSHECVFFMCRVAPP